MKETRAQKGLQRQRWNGINQPMNHKKLSQHKYHITYKQKLFFNHIGQTESMSNNWYIYFISSNQFFYGKRPFLLKIQLDSSFTYIRGLLAQLKSQTIFSVYFIDIPSSMMTMKQANVRTEMTFNIIINFVEFA